MGRAEASAVVLTIMTCLSGTSASISAPAFVMQPFTCHSRESSQLFRLRTRGVVPCFPQPAKLVMQAASGSGENSGSGNKDDLYYQRFMGMNEGEPTDDVRVAAEIADMDPSIIDSLRRGTPMDDKVKVSSSSGSPTASFFLGSSGSGGGGSGVGSGGFLESMKKKAPSFSARGAGSAGGAGGGMSGSPLRGTPDMMSTGPKVYIIPQNQEEAPLEIRSVAPGQRRNQKGVIAEIPGRSFPKRPRRVDLSEKMAEVKRSIQEAPTRLTEVQVQNLRNGAAMNPNNPASSGNPGVGAQGGPNQQGGNNMKNAGANSGQNQFSFPSFPVQPMSQQKSQQPFSSLAGAGTGRSRGSKRRGSLSGEFDAQGGMGRRNRNRGSPASQLQLPAWSRDWRVWVGGIAAVSFFMALVNSLSYRSELVVMDGSGLRGNRDWSHTLASTTLTPEHESSQTVTVDDVLDNLFA